MSPLGDAIVALILTLVIGAAAGGALAFIGQLLIVMGVAAGIEHDERQFHRRVGSVRPRVGEDAEPRPGKIPTRLGIVLWVLSILVWLATLVLTVARIIDVVAAATS